MRSQYSYKDCHAAPGAAAGPTEVAQHCAMDNTVTTVTTLCNGKRSKAQLHDKVLLQLETRTVRERGIERLLQ